jgi:hypothetical protein
MIDIVMSERVAKAIHAENKECFLNAFRGMHEVPGEPYYVEGFVAPDNFPIIIAHAWLEVDGRIVDPTPAYVRGGGEEQPHSPDCGP